MSNFGFLILAAILMVRADPARVQVDTTRPDTPRVEAERGRPQGDRLRLQKGRGRPEASPDPRNAVGYEALKRVTRFFAQGDADALMEHAGERVDVTLLGSSDLFSRSQATYVVRDFFRHFPPARLDLNETSATEGNWFAAGRYWYQNGDAPLSVYLRLSVSNSEWELREIRISRIDAP